MLAIVRQRLIVVAAVVVGAVIWHQAEPALAASDGSSGYALASAGGGPVMATLMVLLMAVPVVLLGAAAASTGNQMSGIVVVCGSLLVFAWSGGPIDGWMRRSALPGGYGGLAIETLLWAALIVLVFVFMHMAHRAMASRLPQGWRAPHMRDDLRLGIPKGDAWLAGLITAVVGGGLSFLLMRNSSPGQVMISLLVSFSVGAMAAELAMPQRNPLPILLAPAVVALVVYLFMLVRYDNYEEVMSAWFAIAEENPPVSRLPGLALALPIHYMSAGVIGCTFGLGWGHSILHGDQGRHEGDKSVDAQSTNGKDRSTAEAK